MSKGTEQKDELVLKWMLGQIGRAKKRKKQLDERLMEINEERNSPIGGVGYEPLPRSAGIGNGAASILFKLADIEERIYAQKTEIEKSIVRVMDILDGADPAMWSQIRDSYKIHEAESVELNWLVVFFGRYFQTCWGRGENRQKVFELMDSMREGTVGQNAVEVFAVNTIYEYTGKEEK